MNKKYVFKEKIINNKYEWKIVNFYQFLEII